MERQTDLAGTAWLNSRQLAQLTAVCLAALVSATGCAGSKEDKAGDKDPVKVKIESVGPSSVSEKAALLGRLDSRHAVSLYPQVDGSIKRINVHPGQEVKPGQLLIEIDALKQEAAVATKASDVATARADYQKEQARLKSLQAQREAQLASLEYDKHEYTRNYWLEQRGVVSESTVDGYDRMYRVGKAKLEEVDENIAAQQEVIKRASKAIQAAVYSEKEQQEQLAFYRISAPFAGTVSDIPVKQGDYVNQTTRLTAVAQLTPLEVNVLVPKLLATSLKPGMELELLDDDNKVIARCPVFHIDPIVDQQDQSVLIKALFQNSQRRYRPEQSVSTRLVLTQGLGISIPTEALSFIAGKAFAFVVSGGTNPKAQQRVLTISSIEGNRAVISSGVTAGEKVIVSGVQNLQDGTPIVIE